MLGSVHFDKRKGYVLFIKPFFSVLGPPGPTNDACLLLLVVIFGLEMLDLIHFDNRTLCQFFRGANVSIFPLGCQIVRRAKLFMVPNCSWCQIVRGAKLSTMPNCLRCKIVL